MKELPETRESLIIRIADPSDRDAWEQFAGIYRPVIYRMARIRGLQDADAQDLTQRVLISVSRAIENWEPQPGVRFRHWLARVAKNAAINFLSRKPKDQPQEGSWPIDAEIDSQAAAEAEQEYALEYNRQLYRRAATTVRARADEQTWLAFSLTMVDGMSIEKAADQLGLSTGSVYAARSRIIRRLRNETQKLASDTVDNIGGTANES
ncbi:MAG: sigma-70 family RNA polymerase sigma factor [Planctomycetota bacterium]